MIPVLVFGWSKIGFGVISTGNDQIGRTNRPEVKKKKRRPKPPKQKVNPFEDKPVNEHGSLPDRDLKKNLGC